MRVTIAAALALIVIGGFYVHLRWRRSPRAYRAMIALAVGYFIAGALAGAWALQLVTPRPAAVSTAATSASAKIAPPKSSAPAGVAPTRKAVARLKFSAPAAVAPTLKDDYMAPARGRLNSTATDDKLLRRFCATNRDASTRVADFISQVMELEMYLRVYPADSPDEKPDSSDGMYHMHASTMVDFCRAEGVGEPFASFCVGVESDRATESLSPREYAEYCDRLLKILRRRSVAAPKYIPTMTLADLCRNAGF